MLLASKMGGSHTWNIHKECQKPLDAGKREKIDYLLKPPKRNTAPANTLILA